MPSSYMLYTVINKVKRYIICLKAATCTCKKYQIDELSCPYVCAVLRKKYASPEEYCSFYYTKEYMLKTYEVPVQPLPDESTWDISRKILEEAVLPPKEKRCVGRPRKKRTKEITEKRESGQRLHVDPVDNKGIIRDRAKIF